MMHKNLNRLFIIAALAVSSARGYAQEMVVNTEKPGGVYAVGEKIRWRVEVKGAEAVEKVNYVLQKGGKTELGKGALTLNGIKLREEMSGFAAHRACPEGAQNTRHSRRLLT